MPPRGLKIRNRGYFMTYIFIYRLGSESFKHDRYYEVSGCNSYVEAFVNFYDHIKDKDEMNASQSYLDMMKSISNIDEMLEFLRDITTEDVEIVDVFNIECC